MGLIDMGLWQRGRVNLVWSEGHPMHGLEVVCRRRPLGEITEAWLNDPEDSKPWDEMTRKERAVRTEQNVSELAELIISWNFADDEGNAVEPTGTAILLHCDPEMINDMREAYDAATTRVSPPLPPSSEHGEPPGEWDLPPQETVETPAL